MQSLGFRLFLFFFFADIALFTLLMMPEDGYYTPTPAVIAAEPPRSAAITDIVPTAPSPASRRLPAADTLRKDSRKQQATEERSKTRSSK